MQKTNDVKGGSIKIILSKKNKLFNNINKVINYEKKYELNNKKTYSQLISLKFKNKK